MRMRSAPLLLLLVAAAADEEEKEKKWQESLAWNERAAGTPMHSCMHHFITCGHLRRLHELGAPYAVGCEIETKWYDPRTWLSDVYEGDGSLCPLRVAADAGHADVVAFLAELLPDVDPATGKRQTKEL